MQENDFKTLNYETLAAIESSVMAFCRSYGLDVSRSLDSDPLGPHACYFCLWPGRLPTQQFVRVCVLNPLQRDDQFAIDAICGRYHRRWYYALTDGIARLESILAEAVCAVEARGN